MTERRTKTHPLPHGTYSLYRNTAPNVTNKMINAAAKVLCDHGWDVNDLANHSPTPDDEGREALRLAIEAAIRNTPRHAWHRAPICK